MKHIVYRIENDNGAGFYTGNASTADGREVERLIVENLYNYNRHKTPDYDALLVNVWAYLQNKGPDHVHNHPKYDNRDHWNFGFSSIQQLFNWIHDLRTRKAMEKCDEFFLAIYEVDGDFYKQGEVQCIFVKKEAKLVDMFCVWDENIYSELMLEYGK